MYGSTMPAYAAPDPTQALLGQAMLAQAAMANALTQMQMMPQAAFGALSPFAATPGIPAPAPQVPPAIQPSPVAAPTPAGAFSELLRQLNAPRGSLGFPMDRRLGTDCFGQRPTLGSLLPFGAQAQMMPQAAFAGLAPFAAAPGISAQAPMQMMPQTLFGPQPTLPDPSPIKPGESIWDYIRRTNPYWARNPSSRANFLPFAAEPQFAPLGLLSNLLRSPLEGAIADGCFGPPRHGLGQQLGSGLPGLERLLGTAPQVPQLAPQGWVADLGLGNLMPKPLLPPGFMYRLVPFGVDPYY